MKEICGFLDDKGKFHKTKKQAETANVQYRIDEIGIKLDNIRSLIHSYLFSTHKVKYIYEVEEIVKEVIVKTILSNFKRLEEIVAHKEQLQKDLEYLKKEKRKLERWWLKYKWW